MRSADIPVQRRWELPTHIPEGQWLGPGAHRALPLAFLWANLPNKHPPFAIAQVVVHVDMGFEDSAVVCLREILS